MSVFDSLQKFPDTTERTETQTFIFACLDLSEILSKFGIAFSAVTYDLYSNIIKLKASYEEDKEGNKFLFKMVFNYNAQGNMAVFHSLESVMRILEMVNVFFQMIILKGFLKPEPGDFGFLLKEAYAVTLEQRNGWLGFQLIKILSHFMPNGEEFFKILSNKGYCRDTIEKMTDYNRDLGLCVHNLKAFICTLI